MSTLKTAAETVAPTSPDFRLHLQDQLLRRCEKTPGYSLRTFAKTLQINPSSLSRILRGERTLSPKMVDRLGEILGMNPLEIKKYKIRAGKNGAKEGAPSPTRFEQLHADSFAVISDWYHYAILELCAIEGFEVNARSIAKALSITASEANAAIERLIRLDMLKVDKAGRIYNASGSNTNHGPIETRTGAMQKHQRQVLEKALQALEEVPLEKRSQSSVTMAIDSRKLPEAARRITQFRRELCAFLEDSARRDQVYNLSVSLYPLTALEPKSETHSRRENA